MQEKHTYPQTSANSTNLPIGRLPPNRLNNNTLFSRTRREPDIDHVEVDIPVQLQPADQKGQPRPNCNEAGAAVWAPSHSLGHPMRHPTGTDGPTPSETHRADPFFSAQKPTARTSLRSAQESCPWFMSSTHMVVNTCRFQVAFCDMMGI